MKVLLLKDVKNVGRKGEIKDVAEGYARNSLLPQKSAVIADATIVKKVDTINQKKESKKESEKNNLRDLFKKIGESKLSIKEKTNEKGHLFASIHKDKIKALLEKEFNTKFELAWIKSADHLKSVGEYKIELEALGIKSDFTLLIESL